MKKYLLYIVCFISFTSCGDFLDEYSQDLVVVKTVEDLDEVLLGDVYLPNKAPTAFLSSSFVSWLNFLDDDINTVIYRRGGDKWLSTKRCSVIRGCSSERTRCQNQRAMLYMPTTL